MKKTFAFIFLMILNTHLSALDITFNIAFPQTCMEKSCLDEETIKKYREQYDKELKENYNRNNNRPNELDDDTRKRLINQLQNFLYYV